MLAGVGLMSAILLAIALFAFVAVPFFMSILYRNRRIGQLERG